MGWTGTIVGACCCMGAADGADVAMAIGDGVIRDIGAADRRRDDGPIVQVPNGHVLAPGFIDVQVNGGGGVLLNAAPTVATIATMLAAHRRGGTTGLLPTLITDTRETLDALIAIASEAAEVPGVLGLHLEGPFINLEKQGAHRADLIRRPTEGDIAKLKHIAKQVRLVVTLAPELFEPAQLRDLAEGGVILSAGHTLATYEQMRAAADAGLTGVTHLYNAMAPLTARAPGVIGAALDDDRLFVGLIADGHHVADANLRLAIKAKTAARVMLVTDAMATAGSALTSFDLQGRRITLSGDRLTAADGSLAGAHLLMNDAIRRVVAVGAADVRDAAVMASTVPARFLGLGDAWGALGPGRRADLVAFHSETFDVYDTWIAGQPSGSARSTQNLLPFATP